MKAWWWSLWFLRTRDDWWEIQQMHACTCMHVEMICLKIGDKFIDSQLDHLIGWSCWWGYEVGDIDGDDEVAGKRILKERKHNATRRGPALGTCFISTTQRRRVNNLSTTINRRNLALTLIPCYSNWRRKNWIAYYWWGQCPDIYKDTIDEEKF